jgi:hypothetical protein
MDEVCILREKIYFCFQKLPVLKQNSAMQRCTVEWNKWLPEVQSRSTQALGGFGHLPCASPGVSTEVQQCTKWTTLLPARCWHSSYSWATFSTSVNLVFLFPLLPDRVSLCSQAGLKFVILLLPPPKCWDYRNVPPCLADNLAFEQLILSYFMH